MIPMVAIEIDSSSGEDKFTCAIEFDMDNGKPFCYRGRTSYEAFSTPFKKRYVNKRGKMRYYCKRKDEHDFNVALWKKTMARNPGIEDIYDIPTITLKTLWDFYRFIGYDYKSKTYA
jgi:hypothetical protein